MANLESCPTCGSPTSVNAETCPQCGEPLGLGWADKIIAERQIAEETASRKELEASKDKKLRRKFWIVFVAVMAALIYYALNRAPTTSTSSKKSKEAVSSETTDPATTTQSRQTTNDQEADLRQDRISQEVKKAAEGIDKQSSAKQIQRQRDTSAEQFKPTTTMPGFLVKADGLNIRSKPGPDGQIIGRLERDAVVDVKQWSGSWALISPERATPQWVNSQFLWRQITSGGASYSIIESTQMPPFKMSFDVRLDQKTTEQELVKMASELKASAQGKYERVFIVYYLQDMIPGTGGWATSHFDPTLRVQVLGMSIEQEKVLSNSSANREGEVVGTWLNENILAMQITIFRQGGKPFIDTHYKDGSSSVKELIERKIKSGVRYDYLERRSSGDHYIITSSGNLEIRDDQGLISVARPIP